MKSMHRLMVILLALVCASARAQIFDADDGLFEDKPGLFQPRDLWDRPAPAPSVAEETEDLVDRGAGRIEDETIWQLERNLELPSRIWPNPDLARFQERFDRDWRILQQQRRQQRDSRARAIERESDRIAAERARWESLHQPRTSGAAMDRARLEQLSRDYLQSVAVVNAEEQAALASVRRDTQLTPDDRSAAIAEVRRDARQRRAEITAEYERQRAIVLGVTPPATAPTTRPAR